jgi:hypothetical protein
MLIRPLFKRIDKGISRARGKRCRYPFLRRVEMKN